MALSVKEIGRTNDGSDVVVVPRPMRDKVVQRLNGAVPSVTDDQYLTIQEKVKKWNDGNVSKVIRDNLYPLAKIIFDSETELKYNGDICMVIMEYVKFEPRYKRMTEEQKDSHRRDMWAVWSGQVSRGLDSKRHNQKAAMRKVFWGKWRYDCKFFLRDSLTLGSDHV